MTNRHSAMNSDQQLRQLEQRVDELVRLSMRLREENRALRQRELRWLEERSQLQKKNDLARTRVEGIISRLKSLEQES